MSHVVWLIGPLLGGLMLVPSASAQMPPAEPSPSTLPAQSPSPSSSSTSAPPSAAPSSPTPPAPPVPEPVAETPAPRPAASLAPEVAGVPMVDAALDEEPAARYGIGVRSRWSSVPKWLLGLFADESVPLSSYTLGIEGNRRSGNFEVVAGLSWQSLSPPDGNWLGKGNSPGTDTKFVQFKGLGALSLDVAFLLHTDLGRYVGVHYGGGIGLGIVTGKVLRTSAGSEGCATQPGSVADCHPVVCASGPCTESELQATEGGIDGPAAPSRFREDHVPAVYPIVDVIMGLDFRAPARPELGFKVDVGYFFPYFFVGGGIAYRI